MNNKKKFAITPFGLKDTELRLMKTVCAFSGGRDHAHDFLWAPEPVVLPTIWIVDAEAMPIWREKYQNDRTLVVVVSTDGYDGSERSVRRPITPSKMLAELDSLAAEQVGQLAELVIGKDSVRDDAAAPASSAASASGAFSRFNALIVDDSPTIQKQIELGLRLHNVGAICADSGEAALAALGKYRFDLIFLDVILPGGIDGYQICKTIKRDKNNKDVPIIMLTSKSSAFDRVRGSMVGCDTYLTKPVDNETFSAVVAKYLSKTRVEPIQLSHRPLQA